MKHNPTTFIEQLGIAVVLVFSLPIAFFLLEQSLFLTSTGGQSVNTFFITDQPAVHLLVFAALVALSILVVRHIRLSPKVLRTITYAAMLLYAATLIVFVLSTRQLPRDDQLGMMEIAQALLRGNTSVLLPGEYLATHHHQKGQLLYLMPMAALFGQRAWLVIQLCNVLWAVLSARLLARAGNLALGCNTDITTLALLAFLPSGLYVTFVYANLIGTFAVAAGLYALARYQKGHQLRWGFGAAAAVIFASALKGNFLIFAFAFGIYFVWSAIKAKSFRPLLLLLLMPMLLFSISSLENAVLYTANGLTEPNGFPTERWLVIGLTHPGDHIEGSYYNYLSTDSFVTKEDALAATAAAKRDLAEACSSLANDPAGALRFFNRKNSAQWNMPTYQSIFINRCRTTADGSALPGPAVSLLHEGGKLNQLYNGYCNLFLSQLWLGFFLFLLLRRKVLCLEDLVPAVILVGGFLFQSVWEARAQYILPFVFVMIPYAVSGFSLLGSRLAELSGLTAAQKKDRLLHSGAVRLSAGLAALLLICAATGYHFAVTAAQARRETQNYRVYLQEAQPVLADGCYYLCMDDAYLTVDLASEGSQAVLTTASPQGYHVYFANSSVTGDLHFYMLTTTEAVPRALGINSFENSWFAGLKGAVDESAMRQQWVLRPAENGGFCLLDSSGTGKPGGNALTGDCTALTVSVTPFTGAGNQLWQLIPAE